MSATRVEVVLPTYCGRRFVDEAVASVRGQSHEDWHLTLVDDASPDDTVAHLRARYGGDPQISLLPLPERRRAAGARMAALAQSDADWVAFLDQDDRWHPEKLARQLERAVTVPAARVIHTDVAHIDAAGRPLPGSADAENDRRAQVAWDSLSREELVRSCFLANRVRLASVLLRRDALDAVGGFDAELFGGEDWDFFLRLALAGQRFAHLAEPLLERRLHGENTSLGARHERVEGQLAAVEKAIAHTPELADLAEQRRAVVLRTAVLDALRAGDGHDARQRLAQLEATGVLPAWDRARLSLLVRFPALAKPLLRGR